jgi:cytochrome c
MRKAFAVALIAASLAAAPAAWARPGDASSRDRGHDLARRNCGMCHAIGARGPSPNPQAPPFRELGKRFALDDLQEALAEGIVTGHPAMPAFRFSPAEITDLIAYLKSIQVRPVAASRVGRPGSAR